MAFDRELWNLITDQGFLATLGELLGVAILLGGILDRDGKDLIDWITAVIGYALIASLGVLEIVPNGALAMRILVAILLSILIYCLGLSLGWLAGSGYRKLYQNRHKSRCDVISKGEKYGRKFYR